MRHLVFVTLYGWLTGTTLHTRQSSIQSDKYQVSHRYSQFSWWWAHSCPKHVEKRNKRTKKICAPSWLYLQDYTGIHSQQNIENIKLCSLHCTVSWEGIAFLQFVHKLGTALWCSEERMYKMICPAQQQLWTVQVSDICFTACVAYFRSSLLHLQIAMETTKLSYAPHAVRTWYFMCFITATWEVTWKCLCMYINRNWDKVANQQKVGTKLQNQILWQPSLLQ